MAKKKGKTIHPLQESYAHLIDKDERLHYSYSVGIYTLLLTSRRVVLKKNISHSLIAFKYKDIEVVEYITNPKWLYLLVAFLFLVSSYVFFVVMPQSGTTTLMNVQFQSGQISTTQTSMNAVIFKLFGFVTFTFGFYFLFGFIMSLFGHLKFFLIGKRRSIPVICKFNEDIPEIINHIENHK